MKKIFFRGLITLLPIALTIYILYSAIIILDNVLGGVIRFLLPSSVYFPGLGFLMTLFLIYLFGLMLNNFVTARILSDLQLKLTEVPFIKAIYSPLRDLMNLFSKNDQKPMGSVVLVDMGESGGQALGLVTRENFSDLSFSHLAQEKVAVYFPLSYGLGGFTFLIPKSRIHKLDVPVEKAMRLAITGWVRSEDLDHGSSATNHNR